MILVEMEIENYKQFAGRHTIPFPSQGVVGVIGANGVGKTTLFEAIEWCLYNPAEIKNAEVPPRAGIGKTQVTITLEDPRDGVRYVVERSLKGNVAKAELYREDRPEERIAQGSKPVAEYVGRRLIGLGHRAFVSTFFTRQKELSFFGALKDTDRRREVGRLLGLETIRDAQKLIGDDRAKAKAEAAGLAAHHDEQSKGRDFATEATAAEAEVAFHASEVAKATTRAAAAAAALLAARTELDRWRDLERRDNAVALVLARVAGDERAAAARRDAAVHEISVLDRAERTRAALAPVAAAEAARAAEVARHEVDRERFQRRQQLDADRDRAVKAVARAARDLKENVAAIGTGAPVVPGWTWTTADAGAPVAGADRLLAAVAGLDVAAVCATADALTECATLAGNRDRERHKWERYHAAMVGLEADRATMVLDGDPAMVADRARRERERALLDAQAASTTAHDRATTRAKYDKILGTLRAGRALLHDHDARERCPTCLRPFVAGEADIAVTAFEDELERLTAEESHALDQEQRCLRLAKEQARIEQAANGQVVAVEQLNGRILQGQRHVETARADMDHGAATLAAALAHHGLHAEPPPEAVAAARERADRWQRLAATASVILRLRADAERASDETAAAATALADLGDVAYDEAAHRAAGTALDEARQATARIEEIDRTLARRPVLVTDRDAAVADLDRLAVERAATERDRAAVGFDPAALQRANATAQTSERDERAALDARTGAETAHREAGRRRDLLLAEHARIGALAERAETRRRDADELDAMYREFNHFEQYVAQRVTPQLAEHTAELLAAVTEGKYDRVEFDENYGVMIFDGEDERFPIEAFSGGERDVAALCARLALSRLIGAQAGNPPAFLVLDEVFGSLDRDRRALTLETLALLAVSTEAIQQLFVISHVEDVRQSAIFDEIWRITETADGVSQWENLALSGGVEEL